MGWNESTFLTVKRNSRVHVIQNIHSWNRTHTHGVPVIVDENLLRFPLFEGMTHAWVQLCASSKHSYVFEAARFPSDEVSLSFSITLLSITLFFLLLSLSHFLLSSLAFASSRPFLLVRSFASCPLPFPFFPSFWPSRSLLQFTLSFYFSPDLIARPHLYSTPSILLLQQTISVSF